MIGIVGAGITGLSLAHYLGRHDEECVVLEADGEPGGVMRSGRVDGRLLEWGPQRLRRTDPVDELIIDLALEDEVLTAEPTKLFVYANGKLRRAPFSLDTFQSTDLLSEEAKLEVVSEPSTAPADPDETAAELFTRKFGEEAYRNLLGPLFGGIYGSEPERMPVRHALSGMIRIEEKYGNLLKPAVKRALAGGSSAPAISFEDGLQRLPEALHDAHRETVHLETPVTGIEETEGDEDGGYSLEVGGAEGPDDAVEVEELVLTTPADVSSDLLADLEPDSASALAELNYNPLALVHLRADADRDGFGYQVSHDEGLDTLGVSWNASMFDRDGVYTVFLGGMRNPELVDESDEELGTIAATEFEEAMELAGSAEVLSVRRLRRGFPAYDHSWDALERVDLPDGLHLATNYTARMGVPSRIREAQRLTGELTK